MSDENKSQELDEDFLRKLSSILPEGTTLPSFLKALHKPAQPWQSKPVGWGHGGSSPYYQEKYGQQVKVAFDWMIANPGKPVVYKWEDFQGLQKNTIKNRIYQSALFVVHHMDNEEQQYAKLFASIELRKEHVGVILYPKTLKMILVDDMPFHPLEEGVITSRAWKLELDDFLENGKLDQPFKIDGLNLSDEEELALKSSLEQLANLRFTIKKDKIILVKLSPQTLGDSTK